VRRGFVQIGEALDENAADAGRKPGMDGVVCLSQALGFADGRGIELSMGSGRTPSKRYVGKLERRGIREMD